MQQTYSHANTQGAEMVHPAQLWRMRQVSDFTSVSRSQIYASVAAGDFPRPIPLIGRTVAWRATDVVAWCQARIAAAKEVGAND